MPFADHEEIAGRLTDDVVHLVESAERWFNLPQRQRDPVRVRNDSERRLLYACARCSGDVLDVTGYALLLDGVPAAFAETLDMPLGWSRALNVQRAEWTHWDLGVPLSTEMFDRSMLLFEDHVRDHVPAAWRAHVHDAESGGLYGVPAVEERDTTTSYTNVGGTAAGSGQSFTVLRPDGSQIVVPVASWHVNYGGISGAADVEMHVRSADRDLIALLTNTVPPVQAFRTDDEIRAAVGERLQRRGIGSVLVDSLTFPAGALPAGAPMPNQSHRWVEPDDRRTIMCPSCLQSGQFGGSTCPRCSGLGVIGATRDGTHDLALGWQRALSAQQNESSTDTAPNGFGDGRDAPSAAPERHESDAAETVPRETVAHMFDSHAQRTADTIRAGWLQPTMTRVQTAANDLSAALLDDDQMRRRARCEAMWHEILTGRVRRCALRAEHSDLDLTHDDGTGFSWLGDTRCTARHWSESRFRCELRAEHDDAHRATIGDDTFTWQSTDGDNPVDDRNMTATTAGGTT